MNPAPLQLYRYTFPTPIGDFIILIDDDGAVRLSNWTDCEEHAVKRLRQAYRPQEIVIVEAGNKTEGIITTASNERADNIITTSNNNNNDNNNNNVRSYAVRQLKLYFDYPPCLDKDTNKSPCHNTHPFHHTRQETLQKLLETVPIQYAPTTPFVQSVWTALREVHCGTITTYGTLAKRCQRANASRAVGYAMRANHICVLLPCHRVIGASQALTGFGSGLWRKVWLLRHEGAAEVREASVKRKRDFLL
ncbi:Methylated-DNA-[protein]-cysteine S-methyltransferase [Trypanosoma melophagium]|uniref:Methylated-DNA-[protein]-cysteine S-methyltransferase n=1 Tax=Trypanosoma melophagium TaxID=715481 RepID=UPI003519F260|nr:Methylated-DNA-[protein]-cysteine S-methyltransferase [Trypanosoma melophagium]